jgi:23S rRNA pseudouridine2457 synthase
MLLAFHKPYGVLSQFTPEPGSQWRTLAGFDFPKNVYPLGRLDADSEGLLLFSDEPGLNSLLLDPNNAHPRTYWAQVENIPDESSLQKLRQGVVISGKKTLPCRASLLQPPPDVEPRNPPIRFRATIPDAWLELVLHEGRNRQVRKMTAAVGHPTLRLVRSAIGAYQLQDLAPGRWKEVEPAQRSLLFQKAIES